MDLKFLSFLHATILQPDILSLISKKVLNEIHDWSMRIMIVLANSHKS